MPADTSEVACTHRVSRSAVTNGSRISLFGDGRSAGARRYRDILASLASELGGLDTLPESARQTVRRAAQTSVECELLEAAKAAGKGVDALTYATLCNSNHRALRMLYRLKSQNVPRNGQNLADYLAQKTKAGQGAFNKAA